MTREEVISGLQMTMDLFLFDPATGEILTPDMLNDTDRVTYDACKGAIEALKAQIDKDTNVPSNDTISRQAAIELVEGLESARLKGKIDLLYPKVVKGLIGLPSAQQERKTGKWIGTEYDGYADGNPVYYEWKCSACGCVIEDDEPTWNFCPNCGAKMEVERENRE